jgi:hypothetical protein
VALFVPDCVRETFVAETSHGGHDGDDGRSLRYLMWSVDPDPTDTTYRTDFAIVLREPSGEARVVHDSHLEGIFARAEWMRMLRDAGFEPRTLTDQWNREVFVARRLA